jgi:uncharacterized repeat protein (TIGR01451 family)
MIIKMLSERSFIDDYLVLRVSLVSLVVILLALMAPERSDAGVAVGTLFAVDGSNCNPSTLYTLDPSDGSVLSTIGPIEVGMTQLSHVTGIAIHPSTGVMYGVANMGNCIDDYPGNATLITIDPATGAATEIGSTGIQIPDIAFDPFGTLYAWGEFDSSFNDNDDLYTINLATGAATKVGECNCGTSATGLAIDSKGAVYMKNGNILNRMNPATGTIVNEIFLNDFANNLLAFDDSDVLFTLQRSGGYTLKTINIDTGEVTDIGSDTIANISAIEFQRDITAPDIADLSLTKEVDVINPAVGTNIVFSVTVHNAGPDSATGVEVTDLLPNGYDYVSDDSMGDYNSGTGVWTVGTLANGASQTLDITVTVLGGNDNLNSAEVTASDAFDPDSIPADDIPDEDDQDGINPLLNGAIDVIVNGPTRASSNKKSFVVVIKNTGQEAFFVGFSTFKASVNMNDISDCTGRNTGLSPGRSTRFRCPFSPSSFGLNQGDDVTYAATLDLIGDVDPSDDTDTEIRTVE